MQNAICLRAAFIEQTEVKDEDERGGCTQIAWEWDLPSSCRSAGPSSRPSCSPIHGKVASINNVQGTAWADKHGPWCFNMKFRPWSQTSVSDIVVEIPGDVDSCVRCKFNTLVPVISSLKLLALGKMRFGFFCMGGMFLQFQGRGVVILVLLDCTSLPNIKNKLSAMSSSVCHSEHYTSSYFLNQSPRCPQVVLNQALFKAQAKQVTAQRCSALAARTQVSKKMLPNTSNSNNEPGFPRSPILLLFS